jgi:hypothetical protein
MSNLLKFVLIGIVLFFPPFVCANDRDEALRLGKLAIDYRLQLKSCEIVTKYSNEMPDPAYKRIFPSEIIKHYYVDGAKIRVDYRRDSPDRRNHQPTKDSDDSGLILPDSSLHIQTFGAERCYDYSQSETNGKFSHVLEEFPCRAPNAKTLTGEVIFDYRNLGFDPNGPFAKEKLGNFVTILSRNVRVEDIIYKDTRCKKVTAWEEDKYSLRYWIAVEKGYSILKMELTVMDSELTWMDTTETDIAFHDESSLWIPVASHCRRTKDSEIIGKEEFTVEVISINTPIDPVVFTPKGMNVPIGTYGIISDSEDRSYHFWNGEKIISKREAEFGEVMNQLLEQNKKQFFGRLLSFTISSVLILVAFICFWRCYRLFRFLRRAD